MYACVFFGEMTLLNAFMRQSKVIFANNNKIRIKIVKYGYYSVSTICKSIKIWQKHLILKYLSTINESAYQMHNKKYWYGKITNAFSFYNNFNWQPH